MIGDKAGTAVVKGNPAGSGRVLIVACKDNAAFAEIPVTLPEGLTLGDCTSVSAKVYYPSAGNPQYVNYKQAQIYIDGTRVFSDATGDDYPRQGETDTWFSKNCSTADFSLTAGQKSLNSFKLAFGFNGGGDQTYYISEITFTYFVNRDAPVIPEQGAYYTGQYRNLFKEAGYDDAVVQQRIDELWATYFEGDEDTERLYYPVEGDMAYILDVNNDDVRSEGMSYGMMLCVQLNKKKEFDALWKWAKTNMQHQKSNGGDDANRYGYFAWQCGRDGSKKDANTASDGEEYFIMSLMFASNRWGDGEGIFNYSAEAKEILDVCINRPKETSWSSYVPVFDNEQRQVVFVPFARAAGFTDPSYHLPAFYTLWSLWADKDNDFCASLAKKSREMWPKFADANTGLMPDYADFDGSAHNGDGDHAGFCYDAWRCAMNMAIDFAWFKPAGVDYQSLLGRQQKFFMSKGIDSYHNLFNLDGSEKQYYGGPTEHSPGLVGCNASGVLASSDSKAWEFIDNFVDMAVPTGKYRYYDGCLYFLNWLNCAGRYRIYGPTDKPIDPDPVDPDPIEPDPIEPDPVDPTPEFDATTNGTVTDGELMVCDFQQHKAADVALAMWNYHGQSAQGNAKTAVDPDNGKNLVAECKTTDWNNVLEIPVTLPEGKTIADYSAITFDLYRYSDDENYKPMYVGVDDKTIEFISDKYDEQAKTGEWTPKRYSIPAGITSGTSLSLRIGIHSNKAHYAIDNVRLTERNTSASGFYETANGTTTYGELMVNDFQHHQATDVALDMWSRGSEAPRGNARTVAAPDDEANLAASFSGAEPNGDGWTSDYNTVLEIPVTLPDGKILADYEAIKFDLYRHQGDADYKRMRVQADDHVIYYVDEEGQGYDDHGSKGSWTEKTYDIDPENTVGNDFKLRLGIESDKPHYLIDNIRLIERQGTTGIDAVLSPSGKVSVTVCCGELKVNGADCGTYAIIALPTGITVAADSFSDGTIPVGHLARGLYVLKLASENSNTTLKFIY